MKRRLFLKFMIPYLCTVLLSFVAVATFSSSLVHNYLVKNTTEKMYKEATLAAAGDLADAYDKDSSLGDVYNAFTVLARNQNSSIWLVSTQGEILLNTDEEYNPQNAKIIKDFNPAKLTGSYYQEGTFFGYFKDEHLSVTATIGSDYIPKGYVIIHYAMNQIWAEQNAILNIVYLTAGIILLLSLIVVVAFTFFVYNPINKIIVAANEYAAGNLNYALPVEDDDELGYLAAALNYMAGEINKAGEYQRKFVSNISHDFRSPLTSIKGYVEAMLDGTIPPEMQEKYLNIVLTETERLNKLTRGLLTLNNFDDKGTLLELTDFDINEVITKTVPTFEGLCRDKGISFDITYDSPELFVNADMGKIQQVLYNLIDNAIKFSSPDSSIYIETLEKHEKVFVSVKDTGEGIPKDSLTKIWERFYKSDPSRGKDKKGTGLGLSITKEIIQAHNENINVVSTLGVGTEFTFSLAKANGKK